MGICFRELVEAFPVQWYSCKTACTCGDLIVVILYDCHQIYCMSSLNLIMSSIMNNEQLNTVVAMNNSKVQMLFKNQDILNGINEMLLLVTG